MKIKTIKYKFWSRVEKTKTCWIWKASIVDSGYGHFYLDGKQIRAHRMAWILTKGQIPKNKFVCHHCDIPACVRPAHLFIGTAKDNTQDMINKNRKKFGDTKGEKSCKAKLKNKDVLKIRRRLLNKDTHRAIAKDFGVAKSTIWAISKRISWNIKGL